MARSNDHDEQVRPLSADEQKRLEALRAKGPRGLTDAENTELSALEHRVHEDSRHPASHPAQMPAQPPASSVLSAAEQARINELRAKPEGERSAEEKTELQTLETRAAVKPMPPEQTERLRSLRVLAERGQLDDAGRAEMGKLGMEESKAAGHAEPMEAKEAGDESGVIYQLLALIEGIIARSPTFRDLEIRARVLHDRLDELRDSPEAPELDHRQGGRREGVTTSRPAH